jgi:hypothetical protein
MKIIEKTLKPPAFLQRELRGITFSEVTAKDFPDLYCRLVNLYSTGDRQRCDLQLLINTGQIMWFHSKKEVFQYACGFHAAMELNGFPFSAPAMVRA